MNAEMTLQLEKRRWWILAVIGLINLCAGSIYAWSVLAAASAAKLSIGARTRLPRSYRVRGRECGGTDSDDSGRCDQ